MKVYVVSLIKNGEVIGVRRTRQQAINLLDDRYGRFCEYETNPKTKRV